jgi:polysaccharide biosynthesis/export protein
MVVAHRGMSFLVSGCLLALTTMGCAHDHELLRQALAQSPAALPRVADYTVGCPDVVQVGIAGRPDLSGQAEVQANGCIALGSLGGVPVAGMTPPGIQRAVATAAGVDPEQVRVEIDRRVSRQVYLFGEVRGLQRAVPYEGPEKVVDLLRRTGGLTADSAPEEVRVVRNPNLANPEPETIRVDLRAILLKGDDRTNVIVQPYDQIFVDESKHAKMSKCLHPWLRPLCWMMTGGS